MGLEIDTLDSHGLRQLDGWDSLGHAAPVVGIESSYGISIDPEDALLIETIAYMKRMLDEKGSHTSKRTARPIVGEIVAHAEAAPDDIAIACQQESVSYGDLTENIGVAAAVLREHRVGSR